MANSNLKTKSKTVKRTSAQSAAAKKGNVGRFVRDPDSVPSQLEALQVGECYSRSARIPISEFMADEVNDFFTRVNRIISMQVSRTKERNPRREYTIERLQGMAHASSNMLCSIIVTRTA